MKLLLTAYIRTKVLYRRSSNFLASFRKSAEGAHLANTCQCIMVSEVSGVDFKANSRCSLVQFLNHAYDFRPNCTPLSSIT